MQPTIMAHAGALSNRLRLAGARLNLEGLTIPDGELTPGAWGEGFIDRRHPHTYVHELMLTRTERICRPDWRDPGSSLAAGRGSPRSAPTIRWSRPPLRYPVNHHLAQILERAVVIGGCPGRAGRCSRPALFNGDEPERPGQWPNISRLGDSWSGRAHRPAAPKLELQGSRTPSTLTRASARLRNRPAASGAYRAAGTARCRTAPGLRPGRVGPDLGGRGVLRLSTASWPKVHGPRGLSRLHYRFERTERPEEERHPGPVPVVRPHLENSIQRHHPVDHPHRWATDFDGSP